MRFLYTLALLFYLAGIRCVALFSEKARCWLKGRRGWRNEMDLAARADNEKEGRVKTAWFHCASLGEFEQGRPVMERFRETRPRWRILLTFFSPSGYTHKKDYAHADHVFYLPPDTPASVVSFLDTWQPDMAVFVKYEYWFNVLNGLAKRNVPTYVISAIFRPQQHFFRWYGHWFRKQLLNVTRFFVQDEASRVLLAQHGIVNVSVSGDTRFDRVAALSRSAGTFPVAINFAAGHKVLIGGSTWPRDEILLTEQAKRFSPGLKMIIAPHEVHEDNIRRLKREMGDQTCRYSELAGHVPEDARVMIIDGIGMLSQLYQYADLAYIGGGFGQGIHNILEAAAFGVPVIFGPNHMKFAEARDLLERGGAFSVLDGEALGEIVQWFLDNPERLNRAGEICRQYVEEKRGATGVIMAHFEEAADG